MSPPAPQDSGTTAPQAAVDAPASGRAPVPLRVVLLGTALVASGATCAFALSQGWIHPQTVHLWVSSSGAAGMIVYVLAVALLELLWIPRVWGLVAGGVLFGPVVGGALSIIADLSSAAISYFLARTVARDWVAGILARRPKASRIVRLLAEKRGGPMIALLRVCPVAHYTVVNYAAGVAGVRPFAFLAGTAVGLLPGAVLYPILGDALFRPGSTVFWATLAVLAVALAASFVIGRRLFAEPHP